MQITRLIYYSENHIDTVHGSAIRALSNILSASNRNNKTHGISGALVFDDQWFIQALEGDRLEVWKTFERIREDDRHAGVVVVQVVEVTQRLFGNWWMGLATRDAATEAEFAPYLKHGKLSPATMSGDEMLSLMVALGRRGLHRQVDEAATKAETLHIGT